MSATSLLPFFDLNFSFLYKKPQAVFSSAKYCNWKFTVNFSSVNFLMPRISTVKHKPPAFAACSDSSVQGEDPGPLFLTLGLLSGSYSCFFPSPSSFFTLLMSALLPTVLIQAALRGTEMREDSGFMPMNLPQSFIAPPANWPAAGGGTSQLLVVVQAVHVIAVVGSFWKHASKTERSLVRQPLMEVSKVEIGFPPQLRSLPQNELRKADSFGHCTSFFI